MTTDTIGIHDIASRIADLRAQVARVTAERHRLRVLLAELNAALYRATREQETA